MIQFEDIIKEIGKQVDMPLHVDIENTCSLLVDETLNIQIELDEKKESLLFASFISTVNPGKFRENVLLETLKANNFSFDYPVFSYNDKNNELTLFQYLHIDYLKIDIIMSHLAQFIEVAILWKNAIHAGQIPPQEFKKELENAIIFPKLKG